MIARAKEKQLRQQQRQQQHQQNQQQQQQQTDNISTTAATVLRTDGNISWMGLPVSKTILSGVARKYKRSGSFFTQSLMTKYFVVQQVSKDVWNSVEWARARKRNIKRSMRRDSRNVDTIPEQTDEDDDSADEGEEEEEEAKSNANDFRDSFDYQGKQLQVSKHHQWQTEEDTRREIEAGASHSVGSQATAEEEQVHNRQACIYALAYYPSQAAMELGGSPRGALRLKDITEILLAEENDLSLIVKSTWGELALQTKFPRQRNYWVAGLRALCGVKSVYDDDVDEFVAWPNSYGSEPRSVIHGRSAQQDALCGIGATSSIKSSNNKSNTTNNGRINSQANVHSLLKRARLGWQ